MSECALLQNDRGKKNIKRVRKIFSLHYASPVRVILDSLLKRVLRVKLFGAVGWSDGKLKVSWTGAVRLFQCSCWGFYFYVGYCQAPNEQDYVCGSTFPSAGRWILAHNHILASFWLHLVAGVCVCVHVCKLVRVHMLKGNQSVCRSLSVNETSKRGETILYTVTN